ncbi:MAG TPA: hypothetical protein VN726_20505 [Hanamia sp.]|nr:hypothetical protein [Hanamia sp.]
MKEIATALIFVYTYQLYPFHKKEFSTPDKRKSRFSTFRNYHYAPRGAFVFKSDSLFSGVYRFIFKAFVAGPTLEIFRKNDLLKKTKNYKMACLVADNLKRKGSHRLAAFSENDLIFS